MYEKYKKLYPKESKSVNGRIFEYLVCETLAHESIAPFYYQVVFEWVPNANFDLVLYHPRFPVVLTMKTSLRERYKQADLEGMALRQVYRSAESYLITLNHKEAKAVQRKIENREVLGLDGCVIAIEEEYTLFTGQTKQKRVSKIKENNAVKGNII